MFIPLTQNLQAVIDDQDFAALSTWKWCAAYCEKAKAFYAMRRIKAGGIWTTIRMHRIICDAPKGKVVDHINHDTLDNRRENLRICSIADNAQNKRSAPGITSIYRGVHWNSVIEKWKASISINNRCHYLGIFDSQIEAARAYDIAALKNYGEFANLNGV